MNDTGQAGRFDRMQRTDWVDMEKIHSAKILVAGAGALGNEALKDLVLAGFRNVTVADDDVVEESNLSRCVLFRHNDIGSNKAETAVRSASEIYPDSRLVAFPGRVQDMGLEEFDIIIGCLDSISARLHLNSHARYCGIPYVDGATDGLRGKTQTVLPTGPCMECSMNRTHVNELHRTFSCGIPQSAAPSEKRILSSGITTTAIIAAACVREAIKIACGRTDACVPGICYYDGMDGSISVMELSVNPECPNHEVN